MPSVAEPKSETVNARLPLPLKRKLDQRAREVGLTVSELLRYITLRYFEEHP